MLIEKSSRRLGSSLQKDAGWFQEAGMILIPARRSLMLQLDIDHMMPLKKAYQSGAATGQESPASFEDVA